MFTFSSRAALTLTSVSVAFLSISAEVFAAPPPGGELTPVQTANPKTPGFAQPNIVSPELELVVQAQGADRLENGLPAVQRYGYLNDGPEVPLPTAPTTEASKTEPDKNTYLVFPQGLKGADPAYDYGTHFLFQGHEIGTPGYITRINLDADGAHRVTLLSTTDTSGAALPDFDGSTWDPFAHRLLFSEENGSNGGIWQATLDVPAVVTNLQPFIGRAGFEGIQNDSDGNLWLVEDSGGASGTGANSSARRPNSYLFRFVPVDKTDLTKGGRIQALQVLDTQGAPVTYGVDLTADQAAFTAGVKTVHSCGLSLDTRWITLAVTDATATGLGPDDNALARALGATPFKRPENGQFRPGTNFREFFFDETGDTNANSSANAEFGGFGGIQKLTQRRPSDDTGKLSLFYYGDIDHNSLDNVAFFDRNFISFVEDRGDTLHTQHNALDSAFFWDVTQDFCQTGKQPIRWLAEGRDASATLDSALQGQPGFQNEGDNEITALHVSDGDAGTHGILGAKLPHAFQGRWRVFWTQQHGDNNTIEVIPSGVRQNDNPSSDAGDR